MNSTVEEELRSTYTDAYDAAAAASHMGAVMSTNPMPSLGSHLAPVTTSASGLVILQNESLFSVKGHATKPRYSTKSDATKPSFYSIQIIP